MTLTAELVIRCIVALAISIAITCACYAVLSLFIWWWLSAMLALIASYFLEGTEVVTIGADDTVEEAIRTMKDHAVRRLPVIDGMAVPLVNNVNNTRALALPQAWVENKHRSPLGTPAGSHASAPAV